MRSARVVKPKPRGFRAQAALRQHPSKKQRSSLRSAQHLKNKNELQNYNYQKSILDCFETTQNAWGSCSAHVPSTQDKRAKKYSGMKRQDESTQPRYARAGSVLPTQSGRSVCIRSVLHPTNKIKKKTKSPPACRPFSKKHPKVPHPRCKPLNTKCRVNHQSG